MAYINSPPTIKSLAPQGKRLPWVILAALLVLPFAAWGQVTVSNFAQFQAEIENYNGTTNVEIIVTDDNISITSPLTISASSTGGTLTIKSDGQTRTLTRGVAGTLFTVESGTLVFEDIIIDGNKATFSNNTGSLVYLNGSSANFEMIEGAVLRNNVSLKGGGVQVSGGGTFTMTGGTISDNTANSGGGVQVDMDDIFYIGGVFTITGGEIKNNTAGEGGGGVYVSTSAMFTMSGGEISGNTVAVGEYNYGGGVYVANGFGTLFTMTGGTISSNTASSGGGVHIGDNGRFIMNDGKISGNVAIDGNGGGVHVIGTFTLGGTAKIFGNTRDGNANNVYIINWIYITLGTDDDTPQNGMQVYIQTANVEGVIVNSGATAGAEQYFYAEEDGKAVAFENNQLVIKNIGAISPITTFQQLKAAVSAGRESIVIGKSFAITEPLTIANNSNITIKSEDNKVYTLTRGTTSTLFTLNSGTLTLENIIIDGNKENYPNSSSNIIYIIGGGSLVMEPGTVLKDNKGGGGGGAGVYIAAGSTFTMNGGEISGNTVNSYGGGVCVGNNGTFTMNGGKISGNTAGSYGGGVYLSFNDNSSNPSFTMNGGEISGNSVPGEYSYGGGVGFVYGTLTLGGTAKIFGNTKDGNANNVYSREGTHITLGTNANTPQAGMRVYIQTTDAEGVIVSSDATAEIAQYFHADEDGKIVVFEEGKLIIKDIISIPTAAISLTAPETGEIPSTTATISNDANFTAGAVTWEGNPSVFLGSTQYTATVTLTANYGYTFAKELTATIDGLQADVIENTGNTATISHKFHATTPLAITKFEVTKQPAKLQYTYGDQFDWSGLEVMLTYSDGTTETVAYNDFADKNINVIENGTTITIECGSHTDFVYLTVGKAKLTITAEDKEIIYGDAAPNYTATYSGFVNKETESVLTGELKFNSEYAPGSDVGKYDIIPYGLSSANYDITFINGILTVAPAVPPDEAIAIDIIYSDGDGFFKKEEGLSTKNKTIFIASTTSCEISDAQIQITLAPSFELQISDTIPDNQRDANNFTRYNIPLELRAGFDTLVYNLSKEGETIRQDTAIIVSPIPFDKIIKQKWGLLIINHDPASNGGYKLTEEYNWFKNGEKTGTTLPYYRLDPSEKIDPTNLFNVELKTEDDIRLNTCEGSLTVQPSPEQQSAYKKQVLGINGKTANGKVYNIKGKFSTDNVSPGVYIVEEKQ